MELFDSNEMMYTKLQAGDSYDVVVPSDYMIQRMLADDALQELDKDLIPNLDNLTPEVKNLPMTPTIPILYRISGAASALSITITT